MWIFSINIFCVINDFIMNSRNFSINFNFLVFSFETWNDVQVMIIVWVYFRNISLMVSMKQWRTKCWEQFIYIFIRILYLCLSVCLTICIAKHSLLWLKIYLWLHILYQRKFIFRYAYSAQFLVNDISAHFDLVKKSFKMLIRTWWTKLF